MAITKESLKSVIDGLDERDIPMAYQVILGYNKRHDIQSGQHMADILQRMANRRALTHIADPEAWQREMRQDRPLAIHSDSAGFVAHLLSMPRDDGDFD